MRKIDAFVIGVLVYFVVFVVVAWVAYFVTGNVPDTLVSVGLGGGAVELALTAVIEILSNKKEADDEEQTDES